MQKAEEYADTDISKPMFSVYFAPEEIITYEDIIPLLWERFAPNEE
jgi:hypothetical protein